MFLCILFTTWGKSHRRILLHVIVLEMCIIEHRAWNSSDKRHIEIIVIGARKGEDASLIDLIY